MSIEKVPHDLLNTIIQHVCLKDQRNLAISCKLFRDILSLKLHLYRQELMHILNYVRYMYNNIVEEHTTHTIVVKHLVFRDKVSRIKICFNKLIKLNYSYKIEGESFLCEKVQCSYYFTDIRELIAFIYIRILNCNMYSNVFLFSQKYSYYKIY